MDRRAREARVGRRRRAGGGDAQGGGGGGGAPTLILEGDALVIDEALESRAAAAAAAQAPVVQATTSNRFTVVQLEGLVAKLRASAVGATLSAEGLAALLTRLGAATFDAAAPALPAAWRPLARRPTQLAALYHAPGAAPQVAWPELIVGLSQLRTPTDAEIGAALSGAAKLAAAAAAPAAAAAAEEGEEAAAALEEATQEAPAAAAGGGAVLDRASYDALTLWFEGDYAAGEVEGEEGEYSVVGALKAALFDIFATAEGDAPPKVDLQKLLLYCCGGAASAFGVLGHADGGLLSLAQLHDLFHREGAPDAAVGAPAHDDAFGTPALERLFAELKVDAASGASRTRWSRATRSASSSSTGASRTRRRTCTASSTGCSAGSAARERGREGGAGVGRVAMLIKRTVKIARGGRRRAAAAARGARRAARGARRCVASSGARRWRMAAWRAAATVLVATRTLHKGRAPRCSAREIAA